MYDELFKFPATLARYRAGPYVEARERFLRHASAEGYSRSTLKRIAWVLLTRTLLYSDRKALAAPD